MTFRRVVSVTCVLLSLVAPSLAAQSFADIRWFTGADAGLSLAARPGSVEEPHVHAGTMWGSRSAPFWGVVDVGRLDVSWGRASQASLMGLHLFAPVRTATPFVSAGAAVPIQPVVGGGVWFESARVPIYLELRTNLMRSRADAPVHFWVGVVW